MPRIVRLRPHPTPGVVLVDVPRDLNDLMGAFGPAVLSIDARGYLLPSSELESFAVFAAARDLLVVDERPADRARQQLVECSVCGRPARPTNIPDYCDGCGAVFTPHEPEYPYGSAAPLPDTSRRCSACSRPARRSSNYCPACGAPIVDDRHDRTPTRLRDLLASALPEGEDW